MELGYARVSTSTQDLARQIDALTKAGVDPANIYVDKKSGATTEHPGLLAYARTGDVIVVHTLDRLGRTVCDTLNLIHDLHQRGIGFRNLADPIRIDSTNPDDPMGPWSYWRCSGRWNAPMRSSGPHRRPTRLRHSATE
ncbi:MULTISPECIES: recombinase family protein [Rhodococcus]|uniref:recombinase family protein n=1 Tax=Rhodococcus TaxID=1827 RepID=UPI000A43ABDD|nr:recombinase family protein [Rhodococcus opacus]UOT03891.1 recombinase family protein [Rhodococcus opacus]UZG55362.1 recombinase family protein [Rhodococcus opacus]